MLQMRTALLYFLRFLGVFAVARYATRKRLRILCYHGFSLGDEHEVSPLMFMRASTFERRMRILQKRKLPVISLHDAVKRIKKGEINDAEVVITFDDGWMTTLTVGARILESFGYRACVYVTTDHLHAGPEVFNVALFYMLSRTQQRTLSLRNIHPKIDGNYEISSQPVALATTLIEAAEATFPELAQRQQLLRPIAQALSMELHQVLNDGRFSLMTTSDIQEISRRGFDVELHTHSHRLPDSSFEAMAAEIAQNRACLLGALGTVKNHLCYPSGAYTPTHLAWLPELAIQSATTCDPGLNPPSAPPLCLRRHLDSDDATDISFEAEVCGLRDLARSARAKLLAGAESA